MVKYVFREPVVIKNADKADPQKIGEALAKVAAKHGGQFIPKYVVEDARDKKNPMFLHFEWDNDIAADAYRLDQARALIRAIQIVDEEAEGGSVPAYISINDKSGHSYRSIADIKGSADLQAKVLAQAEKDLEAWERRYKALSDVCEVVRQAQKMIRRKREKQEDRAQV